MKDFFSEIQKPAEGVFQIVCFSIGKADAFLLRTAHSAILLDCGSYRSRKQLVGWLRQLGAERLDYLITTHFDSDHIGGMAQLLKDIPVYDVIQSPYHKKNPAWKEYDRALKKHGIRPDRPKTTEEFVLDDVFFTVIPPAKEHYSKAESNNRSLVVQAVFGDHTFLFMGDAQDKRIQEWLDGDAATCTWLKVPYHGRFQQTLPELLERTMPQFAVITSSEEQREDLKTLQFLHAVNCEITLTREGPAVFESNRKKLTKKSFT